MNTQQSVKADERTVSLLYKANTRLLNFILFGLLIDIMYRNLVFHEQCWDLFALIIVSGAVSMLYLAHHKALGQLLDWKVVIVLAVSALVAAIAAAIVAATRVR
jgi:hypothetical protein